MSESSRAPGARAGVCALFLSVLTACGGGGGGETPVVTTPSPPSGNVPAPSPGASAPTPGEPAVPAPPPAASQPDTGTPPPPPPPPPSAPAKAWGPTQQLPGSAQAVLMRGPGREDDGTLSMVTRDASGGTIDRHVYTAGSGWTASHRLENVPQTALEASLAVNGSSLFASWATFINVPSPETTFAMAAGPGFTLAASPISTGGAAQLTTAKVRANADGGMTVVWVEATVSGRTEGQLIARRWRPVSGWDAPVELETAQAMDIHVQLEPLPGGRSLLTYGTDVRGAGTSTTNLWARVVDTAGTVGPKTALEDLAIGRTSSGETTTVLRGDEAFTAWTESVASFEDCIVARTWRNGTWSAATCVNRQSTYESSISWKLRSHAAGHAALVWASRDVRVAFPDNAGGWRAEEVAGEMDLGHTVDYRPDMALCPTGASAVIWAVNAPVDGTRGMIVYARARSASGTWGPRQELARGAGMRAHYLQVQGDADCNWTAGWAIGAGPYAIQSRRLLASGVLEPLTVIADPVRIPTYTGNGISLLTGAVRLAVEASGNAVFAWDDERDRKTYWRRFE